MIDNAQRVLLEILNFIRVDLKRRIVLFVEQAIQALKEKPYTSFSARQQSRAAERWLAEGGIKLEKGLHERLINNFTGQSDKEKEEVAYEELQLLDDESLNVVMMRAKLVNSVMDRAREAVVALEVRFDALKEAGAQIHSRAFSPSSIADGFMGTLETLEVPTEVQIVLMEAYAERGTEMLEEFYHDLNELLAANGVLPDYKYTIKSRESKTKPKPEGSEATSQTASAPPAGAPAAGTGDHASDGPAPEWPAVPPGGTMPAQFALLVDAKLNAMQQALAHLTAETWEPGTLRETFKLPPPISLSDDQEESIDHIEAVFLDLIRDQRISPRFRTEFNRLILPMMSLRLSDADLFKNPENPVRRFIRQLALLGFRDNEFPIEEFEHISLIVGRIVSERAQELDSFNSGADALYTIARNEVKRQLEARQKSQKKTKEPETPDNAAEQAALAAHEFTRDTLRTASAGLHLPTVIQHFVVRLLAPWMMQVHQKHGEDSDQIRDCVLYASNFFDLLEPAPNTDKHRLNITLRQQALEQIAFEVLKSRTRTDEIVMLLEGVAGYFDELNEDSGAGLERSTSPDDASFVSYLDDLPVVRAKKD